MQRPVRLTSDLTAGLLVTILNVSTGLSMAALLTAGMSNDLYYLGVSTLLISMVICALGGAMGSAFPPVVLGPRSGLVPIYAGMVAAIAAALPEDDARFAPTLLATLFAATLVTAAMLYLLGRFRLGAVVRFIPFPVIAGFFAGIGLIFVLGGLTVANGGPATLPFATAADPAGGAARILPAIVFGGLLYAVVRRLGHWAVFPAMVVVAICLFYLVLALTGAQTADARALGFLPDAVGARVTFPLLAPGDLAAVDWSVVAGQSVAFLSLAVLAAIILLVDVSGIEHIADTDLDPDRELRVAGATNAVNGLFGGYVGVQTAVDATLTTRLGATGRLVGLSYAAAVLALIATGADVVAAVPSFVLGGLLLYLGLDFVVSWCWTRRADFQRQDWAVILPILAVTGLVGPLEGMAVGMLAAVGLFAVAYSRLSIVEAEMGGDAFDPIVVRRADHRAYLRDRTGRIRIVRLTGFLFFGTADRLTGLIRSRVEGAPPSAGAMQDGAPTDFLILDFRHVRRIDSSVLSSLGRLRGLAARTGTRIVLTALEERARRHLERAGALSAAENGGGAGVYALPTLAQGHTWCEERLLEAAEFDRTPPATLSEELARLGCAPEAAAALAPHFEEMRLQSGDDLFREGECGGSMYLLADGGVSVLRESAKGPPVPLRIFEEGTILGEMSLFTGAPRSATVRADRPSRLYRLSADGYAAARAADPAAVARFQETVLRLLAERLERANRQI